MKGILFKPWKIKFIAEHPDMELQTRRAEAGLKEINRESDKWDLVGKTVNGAFIFQLKSDIDYFQMEVKPRYQVGEVGETVYIKEAFMIEQSDGFDEPTDRPFKNDYEWGLLIPHYKLTDPDPELYDEEGKRVKWLSPLFMPEWAARYFLVITGNSAERLSLPLSPEELVLEGGEAALPILEKINGLWVFTYTFRNKEGK